MRDRAAPLAGPPLALRVYVVAFAVGTMSHMVDIARWGVPHRDHGLPAGSMVPNDGVASVLSRTDEARKGPKVSAAS